MSPMGQESAEGEAVELRIELADFDALGRWSWARLISA